MTYGGFSFLGDKLLLTSLISLVVTFNYYYNFKIETHEN